MKHLGVAHALEWVGIITTVRVRIAAIVSAARRATPVAGYDSSLVVLEEEKLYISYNLQLQSPWRLREL